jgi:hypothetical protein
VKSAVMRFLFIFVKLTIESRNIQLFGNQFGINLEWAIHTTQTFMNNDQNRGQVLLKLDFKNAFNSVE